MRLRNMVLLPNIHAYIERGDKKRKVNRNSNLNMDLDLINYSTVVMVVVVVKGHDDHFNIYRVKKRIKEKTLSPPTPSE